MREAAAAAQARTDAEILAALMRAGGYPMQYVLERLKKEAKDSLGI